MLQKKFDILTINLNVLHNYFGSSNYLLLFNKITTLICIQLKF